MPSNTKYPGTPAGSKDWGGQNTPGGTKAWGGQNTPGESKVWDNMDDQSGQKAVGGYKGPGATKVESHTLFIRPDIRNKLRELGMSNAGINALVLGGVITDGNDKAIVARIVAAALQ